MFLILYYLMIMEKKFFFDPGDYFVFIQKA